MPLRTNIRTSRLFGCSRVGWIFGLGTIGGRPTPSTKVFFLEDTEVVDFFCAATRGLLAGATPSYIMRHNPALYLPTMREKAVTVLPFRPLVRFQAISDLVRRQRRKHRRGLTHLGDNPDQNPAASEDPGPPARPLHHLLTDARKFDMLRRWDEEP